MKIESIGVIIPARNCQERLFDALTSVLRQTRKPDQVLIIDDASDPPLFVPQISCTACPVELVRLETRQGAGAARQVGLRRIRTTHIAFLDSDDIWIEEKLERQLHFYREIGTPNLTAISCGWVRVDDAGRCLGTRIPRSSERLIDFASGCWYCPGTTIIASASELLQVGGFDRRLRRLEDLDLFFRFALRGGRVAVAPFIGARITKSKGASYDVVSSSAQLVREKTLTEDLLGQCAEARNVMRRLESWLSVEQAVAAYREGIYLRSTMHMLHSIALVPRVTLQLEHWWRMEDEVPSPSR